MQTIDGGQWRIHLTIAGPGRVGFTWLYIAQIGLLSRAETAGDGAVNSRRCHSSEARKLY